MFASLASLLEITDSHQLFIFCCSVFPILSCIVFRFAVIMNWERAEFGFFIHDINRPTVTSYLPCCGAVFLSCLSHLSFPAFFSAVKGQISVLLSTVPLHKTYSRTLMYIQYQIYTFHSSVFMSFDFCSFQVCCYFELAKSEFSSLPRHQLAGSLLLFTQLECCFPSSCFSFLSVFFVFSHSCQLP